jgi:hypothetical protein
VIAPAEVLQACQAESLKAGWVLSLTKIAVRSVQLAMVRVAAVLVVGVEEAKLAEGAAGGEESIVNAVLVIVVTLPTPSVATSWILAVATS